MKMGKICCETAKKSDEKSWSYKYSQSEVFGPWHALNAAVISLLKSQAGVR